MKTTQTIGALAAALAKAQGQMKAASVDRINPHFKRKYATLASIIDTAREPLAANGLSVVQGTSLDTATGRLVVTTLLMHASGEWIEDSLSIKPQQDSAQALGSAITYGRRYAYAAMIGIVSDEDDDGEAATSKPTLPAKPAAVARGASVSDEAAQVISEAKQQAAKSAHDAMAQHNSAVRHIFELSAKLGETHDAMKLRIGQLLAADENAQPIKSTKDLTPDAIKFITSDYENRVAQKEAKP